MKNCEIRVNKCENGYTMILSYEQGDVYQHETYIATTGAKLRKMVNNAIKMYEKELDKNAD